MDVHVRIGDNRIFTLKQAVLLYQEGNRAFATLHEVKTEPDGPCICAQVSRSRQAFSKRSRGASGQAWQPRFYPNMCWPERRS